MDWCTILIDLIVCFSFKTIKPLQTKQWMMLKKKSSKSWAGELCFCLFSIYLFVFWAEMFKICSCWQIDWKTVKIYGLFWCLKRSCQNERISNISTETFTIFILSIEYFDLVIQLKCPIESNWTYTQYTHTRYSECVRPKKSMHRSINHMVQFSF